jgi:hypothetical protein
MPIFLECSFSYGATLSITVCDSRYDRRSSFSGAYQQRDHREVHAISEAAENRTLTADVKPSKA